MTFNLLNLTNTKPEKQIVSLLQEVKDPEIPVLNVLDMGIVSAVRVTKEDLVEIDIIPTYSGCPAMKEIKDDIFKKVSPIFKNLTIKLVTSPPWTTDRISKEGLQKLKDYGIAPPLGKDQGEFSYMDIKIACPRCESKNTVLQSAFGSTACKSMHKCHDCLEPFEHFKCHI